MRIAMHCMRNCMHCIPSLPPYNFAKYATMQQQCFGAQIREWYGSELHRTVTPINVRGRNPPCTHTLPSTCVALITVSRCDPLDYRWRRCLPVFIMNGQDYSVICRISSSSQPCSHWSRDNSLCLKREKNLFIEQHIK